MVRVWDAAPQIARDRSSRPQVFAEWKRLKLEPKVDEVLAGLERWKRSFAWTKEDGKYIKSLHGWLKGEKWKDQPGGVKPALKAETDEQVRERVANVAERKRVDDDRHRRAKAVFELSEEHRKAIRDKVLANAPEPSRKALVRADWRINDEPGRTLLALMYAEAKVQEVAFG